MHLLEAATRWALETSLAASILFIPVLLAAIVLRRPIFTPIRHMLGLLLVARLLLPFAPPSPLSIFNLLPTREASWSAATLRRFGFQRPTPTPTGSVSETTYSPVDANLSLPLEPTLPRIPKPTPLLPLLWAIGVLAILARIAIQHLKIRRYTRATSQIISGPAIEALHSALELSCCHRAVKLFSIPNLSTPALFGFFRPSILLPADFTQSNNLARLRLVCLHEIAHLKRSDVLINWLMIFAQTLHWFNPFVWLAVRRLRADQELLCDADVMRILHPEEHHAYGETLLALASPRNYTLSTLIPVSSSFKQLKERIAMIKQYNPAVRIAFFVVPLLAAFIAVMTFTAAVKKTSAPTPVDAEHIRDEEKKKREMELERLTEATDEQNARQAQIVEEMDKLRSKFAIIGDPPNAASIAAAEAEKVRTLATEITRLDLKIAETEERLKALEKTSGKLAGQLVNDATLRKLADELDALSRRRAALQIDFADDHPKVRETLVETKLIQNQIDSRVEDLVRATRMSLELDRSTKGRFQKEKQIAAEEYHYIEEQTRAFFTLKQKLEAVQKRSQTLAERLDDARLNARLNAQ
jgi:bla regulator protein BlaR1